MGEYQNLEFRRGLLQVYEVWHKKLLECHLTPLTAFVLHALFYSKFRSLSNLYSSSNLVTNKSILNNWHIFFAKHYLGCREKHLQANRKTWSSYENFTHHAQYSESFLWTKNEIFSWMRSARTTLFYWKSDKVFR